MELGRGFAENARAVFYVDQKQMCHVIGSKHRVESVEREIHDAWRNDQYAILGQTTASKTGSYQMTTGGEISVDIYTGNLLQDDVDAVVNPANVFLSHGGGAARAIADAAGRQLQEQCRDHVERYGNLQFTQVMHTSAGNMYPPVRFVIHAAGPPADQYHGNEAALRQALFDTFFNCLRYANENLHIRSMSIPAISSGVYFYFALFCFILFFFENFLFKSVYDIDIDIGLPSLLCLSTYFEQVVCEAKFISCKITL